jgi:hypothetical protein
MKINYDFIKKIFNREIDIKKQEDKIKLSRYSEYIPMYDIYTENIYPINNLKLHYRLKDCHYRFITNEVKKWIENKLSKEKSKENIIKYKKNLSILDNYDIPTLEKTSYETLYKYSPDLGLSLSICKRNSFHPYSRHLVPYYSRDELINLGQNNNLIKELSAENLVDKELHYKICKIVSKNDISFKDIIASIKHIIESNVINWVCFYSLTGSYLFNSYLRDKELLSKYMIDGINNLSNAIKKSKSFDNDYYFYRFLWDDNFLSKLRKGDIFEDKGFLSSTRDPFYSPGLSGDFGLILVKINIPKNTKGVGLFIENLSMFPKEEEYLFAPNSKFKLINKDDNFKYHHTNKDFEKKITKKYEFTYIGNNFKSKTKYDINVPEIDLDTIDLMGKDRFTLFNLFLDKCNEMGQFKYKGYVFTAQYFDSTENYKKFYLNETKNGFSIIYYHKGYPLFSAEFGDKYIINFMRTYYYYDKDQKLDDIDNFDLLIGIFGRIFKYKKAQIYFPYYNFTEFIENYNKDDDRVLIYTYLYNKQLYQYLKYGEKYYNSKYYKFTYGFYNIDKLEKTQIDKNIINKLPNELKENKNWKELTINIIEKYYYLYPKLESWLNYYFDNIIEKLYVEFNVSSFLKSKNILTYDIPEIAHMNELDKGSRFNLIYNNSIRRY